MLDTVDDELYAEFVVACHELTDARLKCYYRDSPDNRAAIAAAEADIDAVLDMVNESRDRAHPR